MCFFANNAAPRQDTEHVFSTSSSRANLKEDHSERRAFKKDTDVASARKIGVTGGKRRCAQRIALKPPHTQEQHGLHRAGEMQNTELRTKPNWCKPLRRPLLPWASKSSNHAEWQWNLFKVTDKIKGRIVKCLGLEF